VSYACALTVSYLGSRYFGWQKTSSGPSIQEELEKAILRILGEPVSCEAASRTDRGVHAEGQVVQFVAHKNVDDLRRALNAVLPRDIRVKEARIVPETFHPTLDAKYKTYHYHLTLGPVQDPFTRETAWHYPYPLDLGLMETAAKELVGTKDFSAFSTEVPKRPICTLMDISITRSGNQLQIALTGDRFLYKMARRLAGTLANIGSGKILPGEIGETAPAHGLVLHKINY
jgi:tRNA pseudouridine38-40 synthase